MPERHGQFRYPGLPAYVAGTYTCSLGISPGVVNITAHPGQTIAPVGDVVITDNFGTVTIPNCKVDRVDATRDSQGEMWQVALLDRRWRWRELGNVAGYYNQPNRFGLLYPWSVKSPRDMVELCLRAMGETKYQIDVPNVALPPVNWDYQSPAVVLQQLCDSLGCVIAYRLDTDSVLVSPVGKGGSLPDGSISSESPSLDLPERPDSIVCVGAPVRLQARFRLEPVGRDWDGLYRHINALSYVPADAPDPKNPWAKVVPPAFPILTQTARLTKLDALKLAEENIYKHYRLTLGDPHDGSKRLRLPGQSEPVARREQIVLQDTKVEQVVPTPLDERFLDQFGRKPFQHFYDGFRRDVPAECYGRYYLGNAFHARAVALNAHTTNRDKIRVPFTIDPEFQVVTFSDYIYEFDFDNARTAPANVVLETGCLLRDQATNQVLRYEREYRFGAPVFGTPPLYIHHDDVQFNVIGTYTPDHKLTGRKASSGEGYSLEDTIRRSGYYLSGAAAKYQLTGALHRIYNGVVPIFLDGRVHQVTWTIVEGAGVQTEASLNSEHSIYVPTLAARHRIEYAPAVGRILQEKNVAPPAQGPGGR